MPAARLLVAADERRGVRVEEQDAVVAAHVADGVERVKELLKIAARAHIGHERDALIPLRRGKADLREARNECDRQIIDAVIAEILQCRDGAALARTGHAGNDQKIHNSILLARVQRDFSRLSYNAHLALQLDAELLPNALLHQLDQAQHVVAGSRRPG